MAEPRHEAISRKDQQASGRLVEHVEPPAPARIPFQWHHHPELELTLTMNSRGLRFIGDQVAQNDDGDLVLLGPNLPHTWASREAVREGEPHVALYSGSMKTGPNG